MLSVLGKEITKREENKQPVREYRMSKWYVKCKAQDKGWLDLTAYALSYRQLNRLIDAVGVIKHVSDVHEVKGDYTHIKAQRIDGLED
jgi:hypothetical protein